MLKVQSILLGILAVLMSFSGASAQSSVVAPPGVDDQVTIRISPEKPRPLEKVSISVESYSTNLNKAYIVWSVNGAVKEEGPGKTSFSFTTGALGSAQKVTVGITTEDQRIITRTYTFVPAKVGLVFEAETYTPPFYKGKALFTPQSTLKVVAFPEFVTTAGYKIPSENLVYTWSIDGSVMQGASGYGKSTFIVEGNLIPRPMVITAEVSAHNSSLVAEESIEVAPESPEIILYEDNLLYGTLRQQAFTTGMFLPSKEIRLVAEPYFLSVHLPESSDVQYTWLLNGSVVSPLLRPNTIGLENRSGEAGVATLSVNIEHLRKLLQAPTLSMQVEFGATQ